MGKLFIAISLVLLLLLVTVLINTLRLDGDYLAQGKGLLSEGARPSLGRYSEESSDGLPQPVQRYFGQAFEPGVTLAWGVELKQQGEMLLEPGGEWLPFRARQFVTTDPPAFLWDATFPLGPLPLMRVADRYQGGKGALSAKLLATLPLEEAESGQKLDQGELMRYLAEAVWYPTALLPSDYLSWEAIDADRARAHLRHRGSEVALEFHFNAAGEITRVEAAQRWRQVDGEYQATPWQGRFSDYRQVAGRRIPFSAEVSWLLDGEPYTYWRGQLLEVVYLE